MQWGQSALSKGTADIASGFELRTHDWEYKVQKHLFPILFFKYDVTIIYSVKKNKMIHMPYRGRVCLSALIKTGVAILYHSS